MRRSFLLIIQQILTFQDRGSVRGASLYRLDMKRLVWTQAHQEPVATNN
jgi:hypothetical protein